MTRHFGDCYHSFPRRRWKTKVPMTPLFLRHSWMNPDAQDPVFLICFDA
jgi:hypothetical protein